MSCSRFVRYVVVVLLLLGVAASASADWREEYREGIQAVDQERWDEVRARMSQAVAGNPSPSNKKTKIYGMRFEVYVPHFFLGLARYHLGDCEGALTAWQDSLDGGVVQKSPWSGQLDDLRAKCLAKRAPPVAPTTVPRPTETAPLVPSGPDPQEIADAVRRVEDELAAADRIQKEIRTLRSDATTARVWQEDRELVSDHFDAAALLEQGRNLLAQGRESSDLEALAEAETLAARARAALAPIPARVEVARRAEIDRAARERRRREEAAQPTPVPRPSSQPESTVPLEQPTERREVPPPTTGRDATLVAGVSAYLDGDPRRAVEILEDGSFASSRESAVAELVRAASIWLLYHEDGATDDTLLEGATRAVVTCRQADASVVPDDSFFSPAFVRFFNEAG